MATPRLGLVVEDKPTELSCTSKDNFPLQPLMKCALFIVNLTPHIVLSLLLDHCMNIHVCMPNFGCWLHNRYNIQCYCVVLLI